MPGPFTLVGKPTRVSREFVRAWVQASLAVLGFHNRHPEGPFTVFLVPASELPNLSVSGREHERAAACWSKSNQAISVNRDSSPEGMATYILHEVIHSCTGEDFGESDEHCCSTLTARLKPDVAKLARVLLEGTYKRAAFFAHTKLSYRVSEDHYNPEQHQSVGVTDRYTRWQAKK